MRALKYLIKLRMIGERSIGKVYGDESDEDQADALKEINKFKGTAYKSIDEFISDALAVLSEYRDNMFATYYTELTLPEAPNASFNYLTGTTNESFSDAYEYTFSNNCPELSKATSVAEELMNPL